MTDNTPLFRRLNRKRAEGRSVSDRPESKVATVKHERPKRAQKAYLKIKASGEAISPAKSDTSKGRSSREKWKQKQRLTKHGDLLQTWFWKRGFKFVFPKLPLYKNKTFWFMANIMNYINTVCEKGFIVRNVFFLYNVRLKFLSLTDPFSRKRVCDP